MSLASQGVSNSLNSVTKDMKTFRNGLKITEKQAEATPQGIINEIIIIPSTSQPVLSSVFIFDIKEQNVLVHNICLLFNFNKLTATGTAVTNYPNFVPAFWFLSA